MIATGPDCPVHGAHTSTVVQVVPDDPIFSFCEEVDLKVGEQSSTVIYALFELDRNSGAPQKRDSASTRKDPYTARIDLTKRHPK